MTTSQEWAERLGMEEGPDYTPRVVPVRRAYTAKSADTHERKAVEQVLAQVEDFIKALGAEPTPGEAYRNWQDLRLGLSPHMLRGLCRAWLEAAE